MNILIVSATAFEIENLTKVFCYKENRNSIKKYSYKNHTVDVLITGVGMVATAFWMGKVFAQNTSYDLVFNFGIAGSFNKTIALGDVVNITRDRFSELGAEDDEKFLSLKDLNLQNENEFPFKEEQLINESDIKNSVLNNLLKANGITVNKIHGKDSSIREIVGRFHPDTESMEGAAFLYACLLEKIPCFQIRAISNYVERRNRGAWNIPLALANLNKKAIEIMESL